jgi:Response regulator containing a CheY-like receiver domain and an HTH DNA-binding domain
MDDFPLPPSDDQGVDEMEEARTPELREGDLSSLSEREREVLNLALAGLSARGIADQLSLTEATVRSHLSRIYAKLGVRNRVELLAQMNGAGAKADAPRRVGTAGADPPAPHRRALPARSIAMVLLAAAVGLLLGLRPDLPPSTDLASVSRLVADGQVSNLDLRGDTLFVTTRAGRQLRVDSADEKVVEALQATALASDDQVSVSGGGDTLATGLAMLATSLVPVALIVLVAFLALQALRRPRQPKPAG